MNIVFPYPVWYTLICLSVALMFTVFLYRKDKKLKEISKSWIWILASMRFTAITLLAILLLSPLVKHFDRSVEAPIIIIAEDNSQSMKYSSDSTAVSEDPSSAIERLKVQLEQNFKVDHYLFDEGLIPKKSKADYSGLITNYQSVFEGIESRYVNRNVAAVLLYSDGLYNRGSNPLYITKGSEYPIYTIAGGDTIRYKDVRISAIRNNKIAFLGNEFPVEFDIQVDNGANNQLKVQIQQNDKVLFEDTFLLESNDEFLTMKTLLTAEEIGVQEYRLSVLPLENEKNVKNNDRKFYIDVIDGRQRILLLSNAPHPDLGAIRRSIEKSENYTLDQSYFDSYTDQDLPYDLILLHHNQKRTSNAERALMGRLLNTDIPLFIMGPRWPSLDAPFGLASSKAVSAQKNEATPILEKNFSLFTISEGLAKSLQNYPPLIVPMNLPANFSANKVLLHQRIGNVATKYPIITFKEKNERKIGRLFGEGIWRWSLSDFRMFENHDAFDELIRKIVQYLALKSDRSFFRLNFEKEFFERENIRIDAQLFNASYDLVNSEEVSLILKDEEGREFTYSFSPKEEAYSLRIGALEEGKYTFVAKTNLQGKVFEERGSFVVKKLALEELTTRANHNLLYQMSAETGGDFFTIGDIGLIASNLSAREDFSSMAYITEDVDELVEFEWVFLILVVLFSTEWFVRKYKGVY